MSHSMLNDLSLSFNSQICSLSVVDDDLCRRWKDDLWLLYLVLKVFSVRPMYVFVCWDAESVTIALYIMFFNRHWFFRGILFLPAVAVGYLFFMQGFMGDVMFL